MRRSLLSAVLFALPLVVSCTSREESIGPEPDLPLAELTPRPSPRAAGGQEVSLPKTSNGVLPAGAADKVLPAGSPAIVRLLEPGAEPRADLSYTLSKGSSQRMNMGMDMTVSIKVAGKSSPSLPMPRMTMTFDTATTDKNPAGDFKIDARLTGTSVDPNGGQQEQMARALRPQLEGLKGLGVTYWVNAKGRVRDAKLDVPAGAPAGAQQLLSGMGQSFEAMAMPLPAEPVGVGAKWQVVSRVQSGGADLLQSEIYTLKSRSSNRAVLDVSITQLAANDTIHTAQMPANMTAKVKSFNSTGNGTTQLDVTSVAPEGQNMTQKTAMDITVQGAGPGAGEDSSVETTTTVQVTRP